VVKVAHLSDLHFGRVDPGAANALHARLRELSPDLVVVTGDLTQSGRRREFAEAAAVLGGVAGEKLVVPGNHDAPVYNLARRFATPWSRFSRHFGSVGVVAASVGDVAVVGLNSARRAAPRVNWSYGRLRRADIASAAGAVRKFGERCMVFVACHHPFVLGPGKAGAETVGRGREALDAFSDAGAAGVMTGHVHVTSVAPVVDVGSRLLSVQSGTATSTRQRDEHPSFSLLDIARDEARVDVRVEAYQNGAFAEQTRYAFTRSDGVWARG